MGDSSDNIPGFPGVGEKTAKKFIKEFGSMENLLANTDQLKGKMREKVEANKDLGLLSKKLARIMLDVPVVFDEKDFEMSEPDIEAVTAIFQELEFKRFTEISLKTFSNGTEAPSTETLPEESQKPKAASPKKSTKTAGAGQFSLFDSADSTLDKVTVHERRTIATTPHFYQSVTGTLATGLFIDKLLQRSEEHTSELQSR